MNPVSIGVALTPYLTTEEAAIFLRLSSRTLEKLRIFGRGPRFHKLGRRVVYSVADLEEWTALRAQTETLGSR